MTRQLYKISNDMHDFSDFSLFKLPATVSIS